jgi:hypothetical protein
MALAFLHERTAVMSDGDTPAPERPARGPISVKWHHSTFEVALVSVQALTAAVTMVVALVGAIYVQQEHDDRRQARMTRAWNLIHSTQDEVFYNVGQVEALQSLFETGANLHEINMSSRFLQGIRLPGVDLYRANFRRGKLMQANLRGARLEHVEFVRANLMEASLDEADLRGANLAAADLSRARFRDADLEGANLADANLTGADLTGARGLVPEQIAKGCADPAEPPILPPGFTPPPAC